MDIEQFIERKQLEAYENENFQEWLGDNKLVDRDGFPIVTFHGSTNSDFNVIDFDKSNDMWWCGKGFYSSDCIYDVQENYATSQTHTKYGYEKYKSGDLGHRIEDLKSKLNNSIESENDNEFFDYEDYEEILNSDEEIDFELLKNNSVFSDLINNFDLLEVSDEGTIDVEDLCTAISIEYSIKNGGWIKPVYIKMENPIYYTFDSDATQIAFENSQEAYFKEQYEDSHDNIEISIREFSEKLIELSENKELEDFQEENIQQRVEGQLCSYVEGCGEELFGIFKDIIDENELEFEDYENVESLHQFIKQTFVDNYLAEFDDEDDPDSDLSFEEIGFLTFEEEEDNEEAVALYKKIKNQVIIEAESYDVNDIEETFQNFEMKHEENIRDGSTISVYHLFKQFRHHTDNPELVTYFNQAVSVLFDGIVLDAYDADDSWNFKNIPDGTKHYIVLREGNVKSAIGNNGEYSLNTNDIAMRRSDEQRETTNIQELKNVYSNFVKFKKEYEGIVDIEFKEKDFFDQDNTDAFFDKRQNTVFINLERMNSARTFHKTITHEVLGHKALDFAFGKNKNKFLDKVASKYKEADYQDVKKLYPELNYKIKEDRRKLTEEKICIYAENNYKDDSFMNKTVNKIKRQFIKLKNKLGIQSKIEDDLFSIIHDSNLKMKNNLQIKRNSRKIMRM